MTPLSVYQPIRWFTKYWEYRGHDEEVVDKEIELGDQDDELWGWGEEVGD